MRIAVSLSLLLIHYLRLTTAALTKIIQVGGDSRVFNELLYNVSYSSMPNVRKGVPSGVLAM